MGHHGEGVSEVFTIDAGGVRMELTPWHAELLGLLETLLDAPAPDALPTSPYKDDDAANEEFERLMASETKQARAADRSAVQLSLEQAIIDPEGTVLSVEEAEAWLRVLGEARLSLASRVGVKDSSWEQDQGLENDPSIELLDYLSWLQAGLVEVLLEQMPA